MGFSKTNYERMQDEVYESDQYQNTLAPRWTYPHLTDKSLIKKPGRHYVFLFWYPCQIDFHIHSVSLWTLAGGSAAVLLRYMVTVGRSENYKHPSRACEISQWGSYVILRYNPLLWHVLWRDCAVRAGFYFKELFPSCYSFILMVNDHIHMKLWNWIPHTCPNSNVDLPRPSLILERGW